MRFWLEVPCRELSDPRLLDEHRSVHAYFGGMMRAPKKWAKHPLIGPMDPSVMHLRHAEQVAEMLSRGFKHSTPLDLSDVNHISTWRNANGLGTIGMYLNAEGSPILHEKMRELQLEYLVR